MCDEVRDLVRIRTVALNESAGVGGANHCFAVLGGVVTADHPFDVATARGSDAVAVKLIQNLIGELLPDRTERSELSTHKAQQWDLDALYPAVAGPSHAVAQVHDVVVTRDGACRVSV